MLIIGAGKSSGKWNPRQRFAKSDKGWPIVDISQSKTPITRLSLGWKIKLSNL